MEQALLADGGVEGAVAKGQDLGVAADGPHACLEAHQAAQPRAPRAPPGVEVERGDARAEACGEEARGAGEPRANVEDAAAGSDAGAAREGLHRGETAVVVLVQRVEVVGRQPGADLALATERVEHLGRADGMAVVEIDDARTEVGHRLTLPARAPRGRVEVPPTVWYKKAVSIRPIHAQRSAEGAMTNAGAEAGAPPMKAGLEDVVVSTTEICFIDGHKGRLVYRGYDVDDLVAHSSFEETVFLLFHGRLPNRKELEANQKTLSATANRRLPPKLLAMLRQLPKKTTPMEVLRTGVSALSAFDPDAADNSHDATLRKSMRLTAQLPTLVAAWERIRRGKAPVAPNPKLSLAANFLYMMSGKKPTELATKTFDVALILHADHEFNASTFAARVTAATLSDVHSAVVSGIGALKGPLHGGANEQVMLMVEKIKDPAKAEAWIRKAIADKMRIMGFGHRVYRVEDPRAKHLRRLALELGRQAGSTANVEILETMARVVSAEKHIFPNVDLFSGAAYASMGIPTDQFTPIFAMSRVAGWAAHVLEQHGNNRLIRPRGEYTGARDLKYVPLANR